MKRDTERFHERDQNLFARIVNNRRTAKSLVVNVRSESKKDMGYWRLLLNLRHVAICVDKVWRWEQVKVLLLNGGPGDICGRADDVLVRVLVLDGVDELALCGDHSQTCIQ